MFFFEYAVQTHKWVYFYSVIKVLYSMKGEIYEIKRYIEFFLILFQIHVAQ